MGNCQAAEAATVVIQHPGGKINILYWPTTAEEVMKSNPGHHVALVTLCIAEDKHENGSSVRFTRVRLLKPKDMLLMGQVYRLITSQEVSKALRARKQEKIKRTQSELIKKQRQMENTRVDQSAQVIHGASQLESGMIDQAAKQERDRQKTAASAVARTRQWRPSLQSISESGS